MRRENVVKPDWQLVHISNGQQAFNDRQHSDLITDMPSVYREAAWIEIEARLRTGDRTFASGVWLIESIAPRLYPVSAIRCTTMIRTSNPAVESCQKWLILYY